VGSALAPAGWSPLATQLQYARKRQADWQHRSSHVPHYTPAKQLINFFTLQVNDRGSGICWCKRKKKRPCWSQQELAKPWSWQITGAQRMLSPSPQQGLGLHCTLTAVRGITQDLRGWGKQSRKAVHLIRRYHLFHYTTYTLLGGKS